MENLPDGICPSDLPDIINKNKIICSDPKYQDWLVHYWNTRDSIILRVISGSNTSWSGSYEGSSGSSSVDGQGNKNITMSCHGGDIYSAAFNKKDNSEEPLTLNVIQNATGGKTILDPITHATPYYPIIAHPVVVNNQTTTAAYGIVSAFGNC